MLLGLHATLPIWPVGYVSDVDQQTIPWPAVEPTVLQSGPQSVRVTCTMFTVLLCFHSYV